MNRWHDAKLEVGGATRDCWSTVCPEMVLLPPGRFTMGSPDTEADRVKDEGPQHAVHISRAFLVGRYEVTFAEWEACYRAGGCSFLPSDHGWGRDRRPVVGLAWNDTQQYVSWLSRKTGMAYRLLTEAEWEYAARGLAAANGSENAFAWGADFVKDRANCLVCVDPPIGQTVAVGSFTPNAFGLYDMIGNVWEWVQDCYVDDYTRAPGDGSAATGVANCSRVLRGGAFNTGVKFIRTAYRNRQLPSQASRNFGFRVARDQSKP
jgi:formylglycine-generating enzyme required for sulfatase activity